MSTSVLYAVCSAGPTIVGVPEECPSVVSTEVVAEGLLLVYGTLCDHRYTVHVGLALQ
jgi:hypothetical protein